MEVISIISPSIPEMRSVIVISVISMVIESFV